MRDLSRVVVSGPLVEFAVGFAGRLAGLGYSPRGAEGQLRLMRYLSIFLAAEGLSAGDLTVEVVGRFVAGRRARRTSFRSERALVPLLTFLRGLGVAPVAPVVAPTGPVDVLLGRFAEYLRSRRGLAPATVVSYVSQARAFLTWHDGLRDPRWESFTAARADRFVVARAVGQRPRSVQVGLTAVRALVRWLCLEGMAPPGLADMASTHLASRDAEARIGGGVAGRVAAVLAAYAPLADVVEIRLHDTPLYNSIYRFDDHLLVNTHVYGILAAFTPVLHLRRVDGAHVNTYLESFDRVWATARAYAPEITP